ncbi:MAG: glycoside hydrolase family 65 protein, partial [Gemmatimonadaceae bacterium]|nr:glycoside hydrolase family 65 protein [Gemmatimonadaceae bacterium]
MPSLIVTRTDHHALRLILTIAATIPLLLAAPLGAQDPTFLLTTRAPEQRFPAYLGNGQLGITGSPTGLAATPSLLAGVYDHGRDDVPRIVAVPAWNEVRLSDGTTWLADAADGDSALRSYQQTLNMYDGVLHTSYEWVDGTRRTMVEVETFVSRPQPNLAAVRVTIVPRAAGRMRLAFTLRAWPSPRRLPLARLTRADPAWGPAELWYPGHATPTGAGATAAAGRDAGAGAELWMTSRPDGRATTIAQVVAVVWPRDLPGATARAARTDSGATIEVAFDATPGTRYTFDKLVAITSSNEGPGPLARARRTARAARAAGYDALRRAREAACHAHWASAIVVKGNAELQRVVRGMLFALLGSARAGTATSIPPMGLSTAGYYGHVFWDADTWMFPALFLTHPDIARSLVMFRARTLPAAEQNARANGYRGAMYPWEAGEHGEETTPHFAAQNARGEIHITGDVALAQWQYYLATGDSVWLARFGYPVIRRTADFWVSRVSRDSARGGYAIRNVVSVNEGLIGISNDTYTNAIARRNLEIAVTASRRVGARPDLRWAEVAAGLAVPYDSAETYHPTYEGAPDSTRGSVVPLLAYPLALPMSDAAKRTDLDSAARRLIAKGGGAMMTETLYPVVAAELGDRALVDSLLPRTYRPHLRGPFGLLAETPRNDAVSFVTGAGGFLQQVIYGYTGLRLTDSGVVRAFPPVLPSSVHRLTLRNVALRGARYDVIVEGDSTRLFARGAADTARAPIGAGARTVPPVLAFPDPALDDTAAYQGYRTRLFRDAKKNAVQIYLDRRSGRVVHLWADADDESLGFTARDSAGAPAAVTWGSDSATVADSADVRTLTYTLTAPGRQLTLGWFLLGSMRVERDFQYERRHLAPFAA